MTELSPMLQSQIDLANSNGGKDLLMKVMSREELLEQALSRFVHACEDSIDHYTRITECCAEAKALLPNYDDTPLWPDYG